MTRFIVSTAVLGLAIGCSGSRPAVVGEGFGKLATCPKTPNCVSSQATDDVHAIEPLRYATSTDKAMATLAKVIETMKRTHIVAQKPNYLYAEFTSAFWRFVDDVEFSVDEANGLIHFRSASRLGKNDLGVNRTRMEEIRRRFEEAMGP